MIQNRIAVVLEGGYSLEALEISSEAVIQTLKTSINDTESFNTVLEKYGAEEDRNSYEKILKVYMEFPRYSFRVTASNLAKLLKKQWPKQVEGLIFEKSRRKSSQTSGAEK